MCFKRIWPIRYYGVRWVISWQEIISLISLLWLTSLLVKIKLTMNKSAAAAPLPVRGGWIHLVRRHQRRLSHWFLISVSQWNILAELRNSRQLLAAAHKSLRVLILRRLKLKTHPESSTRRGGAHFTFLLWLFICWDLSLSILFLKNPHVCVWLPRGQTHLCGFLPHQFSPFQTSALIIKLKWSKVAPEAPVLLDLIWILLPSLTPHSPQTHISSTNESWRCVWVCVLGVSSPLSTPAWPWWGRGCQHTHMLMSDWRTSSDSPMILLLLLLFFSQPYLWLWPMRAQRRTAAGRWVALTYVAVLSAIFTKNLGFWWLTITQTATDVSVVCSV